MTRFARTKHAVLGIVLALCCQAAWAGIYQHGTVVRMRMVDCLPVHHSFMVAMSGSGPTMPMGDVCPEYTLVSDKVVFVIVGKSSNQIIPLADVVDFRLNKSELAMRIDDARHESRFSIKEMILRTDWDRVQKHIADQLANPAKPEDASVALRTR